MSIQLTHRKIEAANEKASRTYKPKHYYGPVTLFRAEDWNGGSGYKFDSALGWREYALGELRVEQIPGHHLNIFDSPNVEIFGKTLQELLDLADESKTHPHHP